VAATASTTADAAGRSAPETIVARVLAELDALAGLALVRQRSRVTVRVTTADLTIEVVLEGVVPALEPARGYGDSSRESDLASV
jgi:hypothetical protein